MTADWEVCPAGTMAALKRAIDELRSAREILSDVIEMARRERQADEADRMRDVLEDR